MNVYVVLSIIHGYYHPPPADLVESICHKGSTISCYHNTSIYKNLLTNHNIYILPFVNIDGYEIVSNIFEEKGIFEIVRKNRRKEGSCIGVSIGVDLNRNYGYKWGNDDNGSSPRICDEDYRGSAPFSEPETQAVRDFIQANDKNIKIAINLHTWGNLFIIPFNYDDNRNRKMIGTPIYKMYEDIRDHGNIPQGMIFGNGMQTIQYTANGDATDWMATQNGMISISPELGTSSSLTEKFFPNQEWVQPIMEENYKWIFFTMMKLSSQLELKTTKFGRIGCNETCTDIDNNYKRFYIEIQLENLGFLEAFNVEIKINETTPFHIVTIDGKDKSVLTGNSNIIKLESLKSLESKVWNIEARVKNSEWDVLNTDVSKTPKPYFEFSFLKYPFLNGNQASSHKVDMIEIDGSSKIINPNHEDNKESNNYILIIIGCVFIVIVCIILAFLIMKLKRKPENDIEKQNLEIEKKQSKLELKNVNTNEDSEDVNI